MAKKKKIVKYSELDFEVIHFPSEDVITANCPSDQGNYDPCQINPTVDDD